MAHAALLFDLDGTLIDSDPLHAQVFIDIFAARGRSIDLDYYVRHMHGCINTEIFAEHFPELDAQEEHLAKEAAFRDLLAKNVEPTPGARSLIDRAKVAGWGLAVVTNACRPNADAMLKALGLTALFDVVVVGDEETACKPAPDPYLSAMRTLGVDPTRAVAFEDSRTGLAAARASGAFTVGLRTSLNAAELQDAGAEITIADFTDPALGSAIDRLAGAYI
ncbi:MAG: HAD family phosphatase [Pseudomonadota bacterium]